ncbi:MAG: hypothetical protein ACXVCY_02350 [Pseudobdellovibrionaceae bacterium]
MKKTKVAISFLLSMLSMKAHAMRQQDYAFSIYGNAAQEYFKALPKVDANSAYAQNPTDKNGNTIDVLNIIIQGQQINSILCREVGEQTYACEARTDGFSQQKMNSFRFTKAPQSIALPSPCGGTAELIDKGAEYNLIITRTLCSNLDTNYEHKKMSGEFSTYHTTVHISKGIPGDHVVTVSSDQYQESNGGSGDSVKMSVYVNDVNR